VVTVTLVSGHPATSTAATATDDSGQLWTRVESGRTMYRHVRDVTAGAVQSVLVLVLVQASTTLF
jgi:uncharacterized membrane protein